VAAGGRWWPLVAAGAAGGQKLKRILDYRLLLTYITDTLGYIVVYRVIWRVKVKRYDRRVDSLKIWQDKEIFASIHKLFSKSENSKTGDMVGLYILPRQESPTESIKGKRDSKQCGDCALKLSVGGSCYVNPVTVNSPWRARVADAVTSLPSHQGITKPIRLGVYGDPGLVPYDILSALVDQSPGHTGYTHQWHKIDSRYSQILMASVDNVMAQQHGVKPERLRKLAKSLGYRTFRVVSGGQDTGKTEITCPYQTHKVQCAKCLLCGGTQGRGITDIVIPVHGPPNVIKSYGKRASVWIPSPQLTLRRIKFELRILILRFRSLLSREV